MTLPIKILHFSDVLCVWAYLAQIRMEELSTNFGSQITISYHLLSVFGDTCRKFQTQWKDRGGVQGYGQHLQEILQNYPHVQIHPETWVKTCPRSSMVCHLFLHAIKQAETNFDDATATTTPLFDQAVWRMRERFFQEAADISDRRVQFEIAEELKLPIEKIEASLSSGGAHAAVMTDLDFAKEYELKVSPTLMLNEGRQRLIGNVGYRILEANIQELLSNPNTGQSWC